VDLYYANKDGHRYRSLGCAPCTGMVESKASTIPEIIEELRNTKVAERSTRAQDAESESAFEQLRAQGYM
jgi:sulfate adenylyltransferase subunit 2